MKSTRTSDKSRQAYRKPILRTVNLATKEVLAVGCKNASGTSSLAAFPPCWSNSCLTSGS